jgi:Xaa-Pro aminopeptidase
MFHTIIAYCALQRYPKDMRPDRLQELLADAKTDAFLISSLTNILYLSGVKVSTGFVLVKAKKSILFVDGRYTEKAKRTVRKGISVLDIDNISKELKTVKTCGFEASDVTVDRLARWKRNFVNTKFVQKKGIVEEYRRTKDKDELRHFRKAQRITNDLMAKIPQSLKQGVTEIQIAWKLETWAMEMGAEGLSFDAIVGFGSNSSHPHHSPTSRKLKKGDIVQIDVGAKVNGYCADQSKVFFTGAKTKLQEKVYMAVDRAKKESEAAIKPGVSNHELDAISRKVLKEYDLEKYFIHSLGHGVGLDIHEGITLSQKAKNTPLLKNEIITIEPGVYIPGKFGMRLEDEVIV